MNSMAAVIVRSFGGPDVLNFEMAPMPHCGPKQLLVRVHAAGVGPWDAWVRAGQSAVPQPLPLIPGSDVSGIVEEVGEAIDGFSPGDAVYGATNARFTNGYAQVATCEADMMARKPGTLSHVEAASVPVIAVTAWQMLFEHAELHKGQSVLIHGAAGNVGRYAVQFAAAAELKVHVTPSAADAAWMVGLGVGQIATLSDGKPIFDAAIDLVGGDTQQKLFDWLRQGAKLISAVNQPDGALAATAGVTARFILVHVNTGELEMIANLFDRGTIKPWVGTVLPLADARAAHEMLAGTQKRSPGKIVLCP